MALLFLFLRKLNNSLFVFMTGHTKDNTLSYCLLICGGPLVLFLMAHVLFSSGEEGDVGSDRPPRDSNPPQHDCSQHPDQRCLRANQPADPRDQTAPRGCQTAEVRLFISLKLFNICTFLYCQWKHLLWLNPVSCISSRSIYREILFLSLVALGKENIDVGEWTCEKWHQPLTPHNHMYIRLKCFVLFVHSQRPSTGSTALLTTNSARSSSSLCTASMSRRHLASSGALNLSGPRSSEHQHL